jgi:hypothetical protein
MKTKNIVFRVDPGTYRQLQAEAKRRGLTVSAYVRLMATAPLVEAGPPDARPLNQEIKNLIAEGHDLPPGDTLAQVKHFVRSMDAVMAADSVINDSVRWLVNVGQTLTDLDPDALLPQDSFLRAAEAVMTVQGQIEAAARQLIAIGKTIDQPTKPNRRESHARQGHEGRDDSPDASRA